MSEADGEPARPLLRVVKGHPSPEELAALVAVVARQRPSEVIEHPLKPRSEWGRPSRAVRRPLRIGPGAWRASAW